MFFVSFDVHGPRPATSKRKAAGYASDLDRGNPVQMRQFMRLYEISAPQGPDGSKRTSCVIAWCSTGRGPMALRRTKRDAIRTTDCAFVMSLTSATASQNIGAFCATPLKPFASQGAIRMRPACRTVLVGARRRGVQSYGYKENAGGCHPPGRNTDCRH